MAGYLRHPVTHRIGSNPGQRNATIHLWKTTDLQRIFFAWHGRLAFARFTNLDALVFLGMETFIAVQPDSPDEPARYLNSFPPALQTGLRV